MNRGHLALIAAMIVSAATIQNSAAQDKNDAPKEKADPLRLTIEGPVDAELAPVAGKLAEHFYQCYPKLLERFEHPQKPAPAAFASCSIRSSRSPRIAAAAR